MISFWTHRPPSPIVTIFQRTKQKRNIKERCFSRWVFAKDIIRSHLQRKGAFSFFHEKNVFFMMQKNVQNICSLFKFLFDPFKHLRSRMSVTLAAIAQKSLSFAQTSFGNFSEFLSGLKLIGYNGRGKCCESQLSWFRVGGQEQVDIYDSGARITKLLVVHWTIDAKLHWTTQSLPQPRWICWGNYFSKYYLNFKLKSLW